MKTFSIKYFSLISFLLIAASYCHAQQHTWKASFDKASTLAVTGRGTYVQQQGVLQTQDAYVSLGDSTWRNYSASFRARSVDTAKDVQIWAGFRAYNRNDRYIIALRGGRQNNLYLSRLGFMGTDEFLALRTLDFHPEPNKWYNIRVEVCDNRIRIYLNNEDLPRIDVIDKNSRLAPSGSMTLGGGWLKTEYTDVVVKPLKENEWSNEPKKEYTALLSQEDKEQIRRKQRSNYTPVVVNALNATRTTVSLNGNWLFMPVYELSDQEKAVSPDASDKQWHTMHVPDFWNPIRIWLHGETFNGHAKGASDAYFQNETARCQNYTFDYKKTGAAWYRQWIELPAGIEQKETSLSFDAVSKVAEVYINGKLAGKHTGMFGEFKVSGKGLFKSGKNLVTVKVVRDYMSEIKDAGKIVDVAVSVEVTNKMLKDLAHGFYNDDPAGIWQPVSLVITEPVTIKDVYIQPNLNGAAFDITVKNSSAADQVFSVQTNITGKNGGLYNGEALQQSIIKAGEEKVFQYKVDQLKPLLWSPQQPNLYDFNFAIKQNGKIADSTTIVSGFRTFETKDGFFYLNGRRYWLRGGNHTPYALAPNDTELAEKFYDLMKAGNMEVTRTHTAPYNENWIAAADRKGVGISFEGTWPWLMITTSMPDQKLIELWADEFIDLLKKYRNHPSILFWTVNNEMKFYDNDPDFERAKIKMRIISEVVKRMRKADKTRPICFDSNYKRDEKKFGKDFFKDIDDGDIDDIHAYINWYDYSLFSQFNGEFQKRNKNVGRPLISQEMSSGYPNNETGHPTRFYTQVHQTPQELVGNLAYEYSNPAYFLEAQAFITGEQAEAYRRSNDQASGILHFALLTWFRNVYDSKAIQPYPTYYALQRALRPVLVSAELYGRHFYAGEKIAARICIVNDRHEGTKIETPVVNWQLVSDKGLVIASGKQATEDVPYYGRVWITPEITIPQSLQTDRVNAKLVVTLSEKGKQVAANEYKVVLANKSYVKSIASDIVLLDGQNIMKASFDKVGVKYTNVSTVGEAVKSSAKAIVVSGVQQGKNYTEEDIQLLKTAIANGKRVLLLDATGLAQQLFPDVVTGVQNFKEGDIVNMDVPESGVFNGLELLDLRYFNNNVRELPAVCASALSVKRSAGVEILAKHINVHGYIKGEMDERAVYMQKIQGATIVKINNNVLLSTMLLDKAATDPIAGKLLANLLNEIIK